MALKQPLRLRPRPTGVARFAQPRYVPVYALAAMALALAVLIFHDVLFPPAAGTLAALKTATVSTGTVTTSVSATGTLIPAQQMSLGFKTPGTLTAVDVHVGDAVSPGQVLAQIDPQPLQLALQQALASLASAAANLSNTENGASLQQAADSLAQARQNYTDAVNSANQTASSDQATLSSDQATLNADSATLNADQSNYWYTQYAPTLSAFQSNLLSAQISYQSHGCNAYTPPSASCATDLQNIQKAQSGISCIQGAGAGCSADQQQIAAALKAETGAQNAVNADTTRVSADGARYSADQTSGSRSIQQAQNAVTNAQDAYATQSLNRPATLAQQSAQVAAAQAQVDTAQTNLNNSTLTAPMAGVVSAVTAQAGDAVSAGGSSTGSQAPGTNALLPSSGSGNSSSAGTGGGFITLAATGSYVTVVSMAESDAAKVAGGQVGTLTFDALTGLSIPVHVLAISPTSTTTSNVVNYYVTLLLDGTDKRLKAGMTANATVVTAQAPNVVTVLTSAIIHRGTQAFVNLLVAGKEVLTPITVGIASSSLTEVMNGLKLGDKVVLPTAATRSSTTTGIGGGGGGGGRFGGGAGSVVGVGG